MNMSLSTLAQCRVTIVNYLDLFSLIFTGLWPIWEDMEADSDPHPRVPLKIKT